MSLPLDLVLLIKSYIPAYRAMKWLIDTYLAKNQKIIKKFDHYITLSQNRYQIKNKKLTIDSVVKVLVKLIKYKCIASRDVNNIVNSLNRIGLRIQVEMICFDGSNYIGNNVLIFKAQGKRYSIEI